MRRLLVLPAFFVVLLAGCEWVQYDNDIGTCTYSNGVYEITMYLSYDADQERGKRPVVPERFTRACAIIGSKQVPR